RAEHGALVKPKEVCGSENDSRNGEGGPDFIFFKGALKDRELADESVQGGQAQRRHHYDHKQRGVDGHDGGDAAELRDFTRVPPLVNKADCKEERAGRDAVVDLLDDAAGYAVGIQGEYAQSAEP